MNRYLISLALGIVGFSAFHANARNFPAGDFVPFDAVTGTGLIFKNQLPSGDPAGYSFSLEFTNIYSGTCEWGNHTRTKYPLNHTSGDVVTSVAFYGSGEHHVFRGFELTGFGTHVESGDILPTVGSSCKKGKNSGTWTSVDLISGTGGLYVIYGTTKTLLY